MSVPNFKHVIQQVKDSKPWDFTTAAGLCAYTQACIRALHAANPRFGNLVKSQAQNHCVDGLGRRHARDVALYKETGQIVDFIEKSDPSTNPDDHGVIWLVGPENEYPESSWFAPEGVTPGPVDPPVDPPADPPVPPVPSPNPLEPRLLLVENKLSALEARIDAESKENVKKPLPDYVGTIRIFGFSFNVVSRPR